MAINKINTALALLGVAGLAYADDHKVDFVSQIKPIFEANCIGCHNEDKDKGGYRMDTKEWAFLGGDEYEGEAIVPKDPENSAVYWTTTLPADDDLVMPPKAPFLPEDQQELIKTWIEQGADWPEDVTLEQTQRIDFKQNVLPILSKGGPFSAKQKETIALWVAQGAVWPEGFSLDEAGAGDDGGIPADNLALVERIRAEILEKSPEKSEGEMKDYKSAIPKTGVEYEMVAIPGGEFTMGSPDDEANRKDGEGPQHKVKIEPFWMGKFEVTWNMYEPFMITGVARNKDGSPEKIEIDAAAMDVVSSPTTPYTEMSFGMGTDNYPAICMTQHAANKFCQWLSAQTGHYYRLPTEAEWEYACRAGTSGPYHCSLEELPEYAVYEEDPNNPVNVGYAKIGTKKPNPWGLYDMHGNVMEWCLDQYDEGTYESRAGAAQPILSPLAKATELYPRVARGGSWYDFAEDVRASSRFASDEAWKVQDPQLPKSIWYHTDAHWLGFRLVRPLTVPEAKDMDEAWNRGRPFDE